MNLYYKLRGIRYRKPLRTSIIIVMLLVSAFVVTLSLINVKRGIAEIPPSFETYFSVEPENSTAVNGTSFTVDIDVTNTPDLTKAWEASLSWDNSILSLTDVLTPPSGPFTVNTTGLIYGSISAAQAAGSITIGQSFTGYYNTTDDGALCRLNFTAIGLAGSSVLDLSDTSLEDTAGALTEYPNRDGSFNEATATVLDVRVDSVSASPSDPAPGDTVTITVVTKNEGGATETFDVDVYADVEVYDSVDKDDVKVGDEILIDSYTVTGLAAGATNSTAVTWTDSSVVAEPYYISANVSNVTPGPDTDPHDNLFIDGIVTIDVPYDLSVTAVTIAPAASPAEVYRRETAEIDVTVLNEGNTSTTFDLVVYANYSLANQVLIDNTTYTGVALGPGVSTTLTVEWDTTYAVNGFYIVNATVIPGDAERPEDEADNTLTETVTVKAVHDVKVAAIVITKTDVWITETTTIKVILVNEGTEFENVTLFIFADFLEVAKIEGIEMSGSADPLTPNVTWVTFDWDTTAAIETGYASAQGYPGGLYYAPTDGAYYITASVPPVELELPEDIEDNTFLAGQAVVIKVIVGDVNGNGVVDGLDKIIVGITLYSSKP